MSDLGPFFEESMACPECGARWGKGCSCPENLLALGRGERAKAQREEPPGGDDD